VTKLLIIGDIGLDLIMGPVDRWPSPGTEALVDRMEMRAGFSAANAALAARHLGHDCRLVGAVGNDDLGRWIVDKLDGIETRLAFTGTATTLSVAFIQSDGERSFLTTRGHLESIDWAGIMPVIDPAQPGDIALLTGLFLMPRLRTAYGETLRTLRQHGYRIAVDTGWPTEGWTSEIRAEVTAWLPHCDLLLLNEIEIPGLSGHADIDDALTDLAGHMAPGGIAVAKMGARGAMAAQDGLLFRGAAPTVSAFDTVGAGDSFNAAFLAALQNGLPLDTALDAGCAGASTIIAHFPREAIAPGMLANIVAPGRPAAIASAGR
jgi:ribokinase